MFKTADAFCCAENMVLQAAELDIASCIISRGEETFAGEDCKALLKEWEILDNCPQHCIEKGAPYKIQQNHCLHCGICFELCPVKAIENVG